MHEHEFDPPLLISNFTTFFSLQIIDTFQSLRRSHFIPFFLAEENLDKKYFEGDILTTPAQMKKIYRLFHHHDTTTPHVRGIVKDVRKTWPDGVVYYKFSELFGKKYIPATFLPENIVKNDTLNQISNCQKFLASIRIGLSNQDLIRGK